MLFLLLLESWPDISSQSCGSVNTSLLLTLFPCVSSVSSPAWRRCSRHRVSTGAAAAMWHAQGLPPSLRLCLLVFLFLTHQPHPSLLKISVVLQHLATLSLLGFTPFSISHQRLLLSSSLSVFLFPQWNDWTLRWCTERCIDALNTVLMHAWLIWIIQEPGLRGAVALPCRSLFDSPISFSISINQPSRPPGAPDGCSRSDFHWLTEGKWFILLIKRRKCGKAAVILQSVFTDCRKK